MLRTGSVVAAFALAACAAQPMPPDATTRPASTSMSVPVTDAERTIHDQIWPRVTRCYREALPADSAQQGRLVMLIRVDASGTVTDASIGANTGLSDAVAACAVNAARAARFPAHGPGGTTIVVPFNLVLQQPGQPTATPARPPEPATDQATAADPIVERIQAIRDAVAAKYEAAGASRDCVRKSLDTVDMFLRIAQGTRRDVLRDGPAATPALLQFYRDSLRDCEHMAQVSAADAERCSGASTAAAPTFSAAAPRAP
jgi:hypothetical protein